MSPRTAVITGANSGIGLALVRLFLHLQEEWVVYAIDITVGDHLRSLNVRSFQMDITSPESIAAFGEFFGDQPLNILLNVAGISPTRTDDSLPSLTLPTLTKVFTTNVFGPLLLTQRLLPSLLKSPGTPKICTVSSRLGSISHNTTGGRYAYRASKAALNSVSRNLAVELKEQGVAVVIIHPGAVKTALDPENHGLEGTIEPEEAAARIYTILMEKGLDETGKFWYRDGQEIPW